jgi:phosphomannomutase/phosphoglucomutase
VKRKQRVKISPEKEASEKKVTADKGQTLLKFSASILAITVVSLLLVAIIQYYLIIQVPSQKRTNRYLNTTLTSYAELVRLTATGSVEALAIASLQADVQHALLNKNLLKINEIESDLALRFPKVIGVRILLPELLQTDTQSVPEITNVTLDLIRRAAEGEELSPEVISMGQPNQYIAIIQRVEQNGKLIGLILAGFKMDVINDALVKIQSVPGYLELRQTFQNVNHVLGTHGDPSLKFGEPLGEGRLEGTPWEMAYWPAQDEDFSVYGDTLVFWIAVTLMLMLIAGLGFLGYFRLGKTVQMDAARLLKMILESKSPHFAIPSGAFKLTIFSDLAHGLSRTGIITVERASKSELNAQRKSVLKPGEMSQANNSMQETRNSEFEENNDALDLQVLDEEVPVDVPEAIFRAYDIRGIVHEELTPEVVKEIGRAIGSEAFERGEQTVVVARDGRLSGPMLIEALKQGLIESGRDVIDIGEVPTPVLYFATHFLETHSGVMLTGSHNPSNYNGLKIVIAGDTLSGEGIKKLYKRIVSDELLSGRGSQESRDISQDYIGQIVGDVALAQPLRVVIDCGNGVAGNIAPQLFQSLGCEVIGLYCDVDGNFPNHHPDPSQAENLQELIKIVKSEKADLGLAFDGDGDRVGVVDSDGNIIWPDTQMMLYSMDLLSRNPGSDIIFDVKCSRHLSATIRGHGGRPVMWKTGHSLIKAKMKETGALLAGERSGHIFFKERWFGFDDGLYAGARMLEILASDFRKSADVFKVFPKTLDTPELHVDINDDEKFEYIKKLEKIGRFGDGKINTIDGIRVDYPKGWGLVRASNTSPKLVIRFEADNEEAFVKIKEIFRKQMTKADPSITLPF